MAQDFYQIEHLPNRTIKIGTKEYLYFSGTSYLGLPQNADFQQLLLEGLQKVGSVYGSSRNGNLQMTVYQEAEAKLAAWVGADASLTMSSGMLAGQAAVRYLMLEGYELLYAPDAHPAVWHWPEITPFITTNPFEKITQSCAKKIAYVSNSVDALRGKLHDFDWLHWLSGDYDITLLIDDSHGLGITGIEGKGVWSRLPLYQHIRYIVTASLAKGMGLAGGVILTDEDTIQKIRQTAYFGGCSPMAPHQLYAYLHANVLYRQAIEDLSRNINYFQSKVQSLDLFEYSPNYPVFYCQDDRLYDFLLERNILVYSFSYPRPTDKANTRIVISAWHTTDDLDFLAAACNDFSKIK
ncbi:MAG: aminotransferase class I/II-fold pyridoxal phosphate-dependent enzyme [Runella sp.]